MEWLKSYKSQKWKVAISILPFLFPLLRLLLGIEGIYDYFPVSLIVLLDEPLLMLGYFEIILSQPFAPLLRSLGWWSNNGIFVAPNGPLLPGSFLVAFSYSLIIYTILSLIGTWRTRRKLHA